MNRLRDTLDYIDDSVTGSSIKLELDQFRVFERHVLATDLTNKGATLSLGWSKSDKTRPDEVHRRAIRAVLLTEQYVSTKPRVTCQENRIKALALKDSKFDELHTKIAENVTIALRSIVRAVEFNLKTKGAGLKRAVAKSKLCQGDVIAEMVRRNTAAETVAVLLIDMQASDGNIGENRRFSHRTVLESQQAVLEKAGELKLNVYDVVIDRAQAQENLNARQAGRERQLLPNRVQTIDTLRCKFSNGCIVQHIAKPYFESFTDTDLDQRLKTDGIRSLVVMGYDANVCVKNTIFGRPEIVQLVGVGDERSVDAQLQYAKKHPNVTGVALAYERTKELREPFVPGLLERGVVVLTSRAILASGTSSLESDYGVIANQ